MSIVRITTACPEAFIDDANQLAMCMGHTPADGKTYGASTWRDAEGNIYTAASFEQHELWLQAAAQPLQRPAWDTAQIIDMAAAARAHAALVIHDARTETPAPLATPNALTAVAAMEGVAAMVSMGLEPLPTEDDLL